VPRLLGIRLRRRLYRSPTGVSAEGEVNWAGSQFAADWIEGRALAPIFGSPGLGVGEVELAEQQPPIELGAVMMRPGLRPGRGELG
jgi:hypothetical protein